MNQWIILASELSFSNGNRMILILSLIAGVFAYMDEKLFAVLLTIAVIILVVIQGISRG